MQEFNLDIADKEFIVLVGPSGCGKSTTLRMVAGLEEISEGELYIDGKLMNDVAPKDRDIAMVFQNYALYPHMTVYDNMAFSLKLKKTPKAEIDRKVRTAAQALELTAYLDRRPRALSGGQRQRAALVRTLQTGKPLLLLDEPFGALDAITRLHLQALLTEIATKKRLTILFVTHDVDEALLLSDAILVMGTAPGRILRQYTLDAPRPRTMRVLSQPEFIRVKGEILTLLDKEVTADA